MKTKLLESTCDVCGDEYLSPEHPNEEQDPLLHMAATKGVFHATEGWYGAHVGKGSWDICARCARNHTLLELLLQLNGDPDELRSWVAEFASDDDPGSRPKLQNGGRLLPSKPK